MLGFEKFTKNGGFRVIHGNERVLPDVLWCRACDDLFRVRVCGEGARPGRCGGGRYPELILVQAQHEQRTLGAAQVLDELVREVLNEDYGIQDTVGGRYCLID